ncbi:MAG: coproporphyrinogen III oxidase [Firmicutes bacterium HGW-Firmicutes-9]|jgi:oxygen-independent coproporphyrinogen-3 oxidase|nr:MAG: coproporphyrinogen III oxidase [Firmicutes bacterium HGW-Firmicutes-9]
MAGIYLHIPFCVRKCAYCDFVSFAEGSVPQSYVDALLTELELVARGGSYPAAFDTVFFGGGTPSLLSGEQMQQIMRGLKERFDIRESAEISMESNPGTTTPEKLAAYRAAGINRLSIGLQSTHDVLLKSVGRIHTFEQFLSTLQSARKACFTNINVDLMHGLPNQTVDQYLDSIKTVCDLGVQHISAYSLILEEHTPLFDCVERGEVKPPDEDLVADMQDAGIDLLEQRGYHRYEISNFAQDGYVCRHNLNYWHNGEYLGFGIAAHGVVRDRKWTRYANASTLDEYMRLLSRGKRPLAETIRLAPRDEMFECVMLGFRLIRGIDRATFLARFGLDIVEAYAYAFEQLRKRGWLIEAEDRVALNRGGLDFQNEALGFFM